MKTRSITVFLIVIEMALVPTLAMAATKPEPQPKGMQLQTPGDPIALNLNLGSEPVSLDPAKEDEAASSTVIEQLFIGLVSLDNTTGAVQPELATTWTVSPDSTVYTFTLRSDAYWTDGHQVTAQDVRYGILRILNPATGAVYPNPLYIIKNAQGYHNGTITDPNQVGVVVLDTTHLQITLEYAASYALSIFSMQEARPMPQWAIDTWSNAWTDPSHIVTDGPYQLTEWVHNTDILLDKYPNYYDAANVQIDHVKMWIVDSATAWTMYLNDQLDTANVPAGTALDPVLRQQVYKQLSGCTEYYGFNTSKPPFNNVLVRKAFVAATNRQGLINSKLGGAPQPALTFTAPGIFGHVDGVAQGVGIPYNPFQAQQWLAQAGYPNGQGLPSITLSFNTNSVHQTNAEYIRDSWYTTLGVSVTLQSVAWSTYLSQEYNGQYQVWRLGWCADYSDANNFLYDGIASEGNGFGGWNNPTYWSLVNQAAREQDPNTRLSLYKQAEQILVQTDTAMLPLYYSAYVVASKPYLTRTFPTAGSFDIATWRITTVSGTASSASGGTVTSYDGSTTIQVPAGTFTNTVTITESPDVGMPPSGNLTGIGHMFNATAVYSSTGQTAQPAPGQTYSLVVHYTSADVGPAIENTLALYYWNGSQWVKETSSTVNMTSKTVTATPNHFSVWAVFGQTNRLFLPLILR